MRLRWLLPCVLLAGCPHNKGPDITGGGGGSGSGAPADAAPVAEIEPVAVVPVTAETFTDPPTCVGFTGDGKGAYVLLGYADRSVPTWEIGVTAVGEADDPGGYNASADSADPAGATKVVQPLVDQINQWVATQSLQGCVTVDVPADVTAPDIEGADPGSITPIAAYTAAHAGTIVVFSGGAEGGFAKQQAVWIP